MLITLGLILLILIMVSVETEVSFRLLLCVEIC